MIGHPQTLAARKKISEFQRGKILSRKTKEKISIALQGTNSYRWNGDDVNLHQKHRRIWKLKGKAKRCSDCGTTKGRIHWSNKDHKYSSDPNDYVERCVRCHHKYDKEKGLR